MSKYLIKQEKEIHQGSREVHHYCTAGGYFLIRVSLLLLLSPQGKQAYQTGTSTWPHWQCVTPTIMLRDKHRLRQVTAVTHNFHHDQIFSRVFVHTCIKVPVKSAFISVFEHVASSACSGADCGRVHIAPEPQLCSPCVWRSAVLH